MNPASRAYVAAAVHLAAARPDGTRTCHAAFVTEVHDSVGTVSLVEFAGSELTQHANVSYDADLWLGAAIPGPCNPGGHHYPPSTWHWPVWI